MWTLPGSRTHVVRARVTAPLFDLPLRGSEAVGLQHVVEVHVAADVQLVRAVEGDAAVGEGAGEDAVHVRRAELALDVVADQGEPGRAEAFAPLLGSRAMNTGMLLTKAQPVSRAMSAPPFRRGLPGADRQVVHEDLSTPDLADLLANALGLRLVGGRVVDGFSEADALRVLAAGAVEDRAAGHGDVLRVGPRLVLRDTLASRFWPAVRASKRLRSDLVGVDVPGRDGGSRPKRCSRRSSECVRPVSSGSGGRRGSTRTPSPIRAQGAVADADVATRTFSCW